jgi:hypothetical protein
VRPPPPPAVVSGRGVASSERGWDLREGQVQWYENGPLMERGEGQMGNVGLDIKPRSQ